MQKHEQIIREAIDTKTRQTYGEGGRAAAKIYRENPIDAEILLYAVAILANRVAELEEGEASQEAGNIRPSITDFSHNYDEKTIREYFNQKGFNVSPEDPTEVMLEAFSDATGFDFHGSIADGYRAMMKACNNSVKGKE